MGGAVARIAAVLLLAAAARAQQVGSGQAGATPAEIVVDDECRMVSTDMSNPAKPKVRRHWDPVICHRESAKNTEVWEKKLVNGRFRDVRALVSEQEFVLQNPYPDALTFVVTLKLDKNFHVDSEPKPNAVVGQLATFRVHAGAGETVRLHVGERN